MRSTPRRGFTLVELMVASAIALILVAAAASLAGAMARSVRRAEEQADLGNRAAVAHAFLATLLSSTAYAWPVTHKLSATTSTGSFGEGACTPSTGLCTARGAVFPLRLCRSSTVDKAVCDAPTTTEADALWTYVPRDDVIEAVSIVNRTATALTPSCTSGNVPATVSFDVKGATSQAWAADDLVLVHRGGHASFATVQAAFAAGADATAARALTLDLGDGSNLVVDDGNDASACSALSSLVGAKVMRVRQVVLKLAGGTLLYGHRDQGGAALAFDPVVGDVDDLGLQLDVARLPASGAPAVCTANTGAAFDGTALTGGACNGERLNGAAAAGTVLRVVGLRVGVLLRTAVATQLVNTTTAGLFDRTTSFTDQRLRRTSLLYVGLPHASSF